MVDFKRRDELVTKELVHGEKLTEPEAREYCKLEAEITFPGQPGMQALHELYLLAKRGLGQPLNQTWSNLLPMHYTKLIEENESIQ